MASARSEELINQMVDYSVSVVNLVEKSRLPLSIKDQLIRSASSIGANFAEAQESASKKDFINKILIAKKEANETKYWLKLPISLVQKINDLLMIPKNS